jgi:hypothetical protein
MRTGAGVDAGVAERLVERLVRVRQIDVLADHADLDLVLRMLERDDELVPGRQVGRPRAMPSAKQTISSSPARAASAGSCRSNPRPTREITASSARWRTARSWRARPPGSGGRRGTAAHRAGCRSRAASAPMLGGLGLEFAGHGMNGTSVRCTKQQLPRPRLQAHLAGRLEERQRLDVAHGAADLDDRDVGLAVPGGAGAALDERLDLVGDVRDHLHGLARGSRRGAPSDHRLVDLAGGEVVHRRILAG